MKKYVAQVLFVFIIFYLLDPAYAQVKNKKGKPNANLILADKHFDNMEYYLAANEYARVLKADSSDSYAMFQLAECYRLYYNYRAAEIYYHKVATRYRGTYPLARYWYATMLKDNGDYKKAIENFERYRNENSDTNLETGLYRERALNEIKGCYLAIAENNKPKKLYGFRCLPPPVNSAESDYSPILIDNDTCLAVTTARLGALGINENKSFGGAFSDVQRFEKKNDTLWEPLKGVHRDEFERLNTAYDECSGSFAKNKTKYYFTRCDEIFVVDNYKEVNCLIYMSEYKNGRWEEAKRLNNNINAPGQWNSQPSVSPDGNILFFVSKRPGGFGMQDIWFSTCNSDDHWGPPVNLGNGVNTLFSDVSPRYYAEEKVLFFSSNGHGGYGALDLFMTREENGFEHSVNIGYPFNSNRDDFYFLLGEKKGYVTSNREGGIGNDDIYTFDIRSKKNLIRHIEDSSVSEDDESIAVHKTSKEEPIMDIPVNKYHNQKFVHMSGMLMDSATKAPAKEIEIRIVDEYGEAVAKSKTGEDGRYKFYNIPTNKEYNMVLNNPDAGNRNILASKPTIEYSEKTVPVIEKKPEPEVMIPMEFMVTGISKDTMKDYKAFMVEGTVVDSLGKPVSKGQVQLIDEFGNVVQVATPDGNGFYKVENVTDTKAYKVVYKVTAYKSEKFVTSSYKLSLEANTQVPPSTDALIAIVDKSSVPGAKSITIDGIILFENSRNPAANATILLADANGLALKTSRTDKNGYYKFSNLGGDGVYKVILHQGDLMKNSEEKKYLAEKVNVHGSAASASRQLFDNIYFDFDSYVLRSEAEKVLDDLVQYCKRDSSVQIELYANTDSYGSSQYNKLLAANRGRAAMDYLISKGVKQSSMVVNSVGENRAVASNETELGRQLNRRVEFYVLGSANIESNPIMHVIETNKTVSSLASEYNMSVEELKELNGLVGDELVAYTPIRVKRRGADIGLNESTSRISSANNKLEQTLIAKNQSINKNFNPNNPEYKKYLDSVALVDKLRNSNGYNRATDIGYYTAQPGNTLTDIARLYGMTPDKIQTINAIETDTIAAVQKVKINYDQRDPFVQGYIVKEGDTLEEIARRFDLSAESLVAINRLKGYTLSKNMVIRFVE
ncbi:MAG TPA: LysM peptidoglycan-binding domain-containing protein [Cytophagaceae bacterium]|nr:LysM peptidoglycan-binding domain-containing protein [Cytophagaceae bacterium]